MTATKRASLGTVLGTVLVLGFVTACVPGGTARLTPAQLTSLRATAAAAAPFELTLIAGGERISFEHPPAGDRSGASAPYALAAARNETVGAQAVVLASLGARLHAVTIALSPFRDSGGRAAPGITAALYREIEVMVRKPSAMTGRPRSLGAGKYPDALVPFIDDATGKPPVPARFRAQPAAIAPGHAQAYWFDVAVASGTAPGDYTATLTASAREGSASRTISLHVWRFSMPDAPSLDSAFDFDHWANATPENLRELLRHRVQPFPVPPQDQAWLRASYGLKMAGLPYSSGAYFGHCVMAPPPSIATLKRAVAQQRVSYLYDQSADEIESCSNLHRTLVPMERLWSQHLHAAGVLNLLTMQPIPALEDDGTGTGRPAVDIWTMLSYEYDRHRSEVAKVLANGARAWWYTALAQDAYSPKWQIDVAPANYRVPALIDVQLGLTGELYWAVDYWNRDVWEEPVYAQGSSSFAGEGVLLYPGAPAGTVGAVPSMRLKWIRDGMYDADEVALLKACGLGAWALEQTRPVAQNFHRWTEDSAALDRVHRALAARLDADCPA